MANWSKNGRFNKLKTGRFLLIWHLGSKNFLDEEVVTWKPNEQLTMRITGTNMPFKTAEIRFYLPEEAGKTAVTCSPNYTLKLGK